MKDVIFSKRKGQSQKPNEIYSIIESLVPNGNASCRVFTIGYYVEIFGRRNNNNKVVTMPGQGQPIRMVISQPTTFEQSDEICSFLKEKKSVIVNLEYVNKDVARRIVDFISGGVYALDGYIQKVSNSIFLVAPSNYEITNEMAREEIKNKLSVSWLKNNGVN